MNPQQISPQQQPSIPPVPPTAGGTVPPSMPLPQQPVIQQPMPQQPIQPPVVPQQPSMPQQGIPTQPQMMQQPAQQTPLNGSLGQLVMQPQAAGQAPQPTQPQPQVIKGNPNSTQNTLQIAEIRDGIVIMNDGSFRSVVMVKSINFDLMSPQEQEAVEYSYQGFLNSLYYPIQIFVRSQRVDLQPYIEKLDRIRVEHDNMLLALLMEDYITYISQLGQQANIMDKKFYIAIPYDPHENDKVQPMDQSKNFFSGLAGMFSSKEVHVTINENDLETGKTELRNRVQALLSGLLQCGVQGLPLDTQELIELYYDSYNPDTATRQQLKDFNQLTADVVTKGQGMAPQQHLQRELQ